MKLFKIILFSLFFIVFAYAKEKKPIDINIDSITMQAKMESKHALLFFHMTHCPYCTKMEKFTFKNKDIKKQLDKSFIFVDVNIDDDDNIKYKNFSDSKRQFAKHLAISFYPTVLFIKDYWASLEPVPLKCSITFFGHTLVIVTFITYW